MEMYVEYDRCSEGPSESTKRRGYLPICESPRHVCRVNPKLAPGSMARWLCRFFVRPSILTSAQLCNLMGPHAISRWMAMSKQTARLQASWSSVWFPYGLTGYLLCQTHLLLRHAVACDHRFGTTFKLVESTETLPTSILVLSPSPHLTL